jgi:hypothetical protein
MAQLINITSEALQATIRRLLPSQQGFGEDLQATNVVTPIIDLTPTAEGSSVPQYLQTALAFTDATSFSVNNTTTNLTTTSGFYRVVGVATLVNSTSSARDVKFQITDGSTTKVIWKMEVLGKSTQDNAICPFDFTVFLAPGDTLQANDNGGGGFLGGSVRQVATVTGELVNPSDFTPQ